MLVGHQKIIDYLTRSVFKNQIAHSYLFYGPKNIGKTSVAQYFAQTLLCSSFQKDGDKLIPCQKCEDCQKIAKNIHPDFLYLKGEEMSSLGIDDMRRVKAFFNLRPVKGKYKIALISEAEKLTEAAINSGLKLLEETAEGGVIILTSSNINRFPPTFFSRLQMLRFYPPSKTEIISWLKKQYPSYYPMAEELLFFSNLKPGLISSFLENKTMLSSFKNNLKEAIQFLISSDFEESISFFNDQSKLGDKLDSLLWAVHILILNKFNPEKTFKSFAGNLNLTDFSSQKLFSKTSKIFASKFYLERNVNPNLISNDLLF